ncbi:hypothetical protein [Catenuloplanes japonicus]|uniref:hypothetical protein n=1 Tax=Catenuloplanes japonicus TaxID=33876 RepID=UPI00068C1C9E|nr:hypothetical protein [Catenuloplanes japonicus]
MSAAEAVLATLTQPSGPVLTLLSGPAGIGRTHALGQVRDALTLADRPVLDLRLAPEDRDEPWYLAGRLLAGLAALTPVAGGAGRPRAVVEPPAAALVRALHRRPGLVILVDDLQWADPESAGALTTALHDVARAPVRCVATFYTGGKLPAGLLAGFAELRAAGLAHDERLRPLSPAEADALVHRLLNATPHHALRARLRRLSRGRPGALIASVQGYRGSPMLRVTHRRAYLTDATAMPDIPADHDLLAPVRRLGPATGRIARALAALEPLGDAVPTLIARACGIPPDEVDTGLATLRDEGLAHDHRITVPATAIALRSGLGPYERRRLAQVAAEAIWSGEASCTDPGFLPDQLAVAGTLVDARRALTTLRDHASAAAVRAPTSAARWWAGAAALSSDPVDRAEALLALAAADIGAGRHTSAQISLQHLLTDPASALTGPAREEAELLSVAAARAARGLDAVRPIASGEPMPGVVPTPAGAPERRAVPVAHGDPVRTDAAGDVADGAGRAESVRADAAGEVSGVFGRADVRAASVRAEAASEMSGGFGLADIRAASARAEAASEMSGGFGPAEIRAASARPDAAEGSGRAGIRAESAHTHVPGNAARAAALCLLDRWQEAGRVHAAATGRAGPGADLIGAQIAAVTGRPARSIRTMVDDGGPGAARRRAAAAVERVGLALVTGDLAAADRGLAATGLTAASLPAPERCLFDWRRGRWPESLDAAMLSLAAHLAATRHTGHAAVHRAAAEILLATGWPTRARTVLDGARADVPLPHLLAPIEAELEWALGDAAGAVRITGDALAAAARHGLIIGTDELWTAAAEYAAERGDQIAAAEAAASATAVAGVLGTDAAVLRAAVAQLIAAGPAPADRAPGSAKPAEAADDVVAAARALGQPYELARTLERVVRWTGHRPELLSEAYEILGDLGAMLHRSRIRQAMREHGLAVPGRAETLAEGDQLLAALVAEGLSNRQLAAATQSSEKSVEGRLSRLFTRTGYRSRVELAAAVLVGDYRIG